MADSANVSIPAPPDPSVAGTFHSAPLATVPPVDASTELAVDFVDLGYVGVEGYTIDPARTVNKHRAFGGNVVATSQDEYSWTIQLWLIEDKNLDVLRTIVGDANVNTTGDITKVSYNELRLPRKMYVADTRDGDYLKRLVIEEGQVTTVAAFSWVHTEMVRYQVTIEAYPPAGQADNAYELRETVDGS